MATRRKTSSQSTSASPFGYIIFGIVIGLGLAAAGAYYFRSNEPTAASTATTKPVAPLTAPTAQQPATVSPQPVTPQAPVVSPAPQSQSVPQATTPQTTVQPPTQTVTPNKTAKPSPDQIGALINGMNNKETPKEYIPTYLQVGSFRSAEEADAQRAQLLLQGFSNISIHKTKVDNTDFFRVRVGPYSSEQALKDAQNRLKTNSIQATPIR